MNGELKHIFDKSACLSRRQLKDYISGHMANEECHAVEHHLNDCPLCSAAVDGMLVNTEKSLATVAGLNTDFLKEHFGINDTEVLLNSMTPEAAAAPQVIKPARAKANIQPLWRKMSVAAAIVLAFGLFWYMKFGRGGTQNTMIAQKLDSEPVASPPVQNEDRSAENMVAAAPPADTVASVAAEPAADKLAEAEAKPAPAAVAPPEVTAAAAKKAKDEKIADEADAVKKAKAEAAKKTLVAAAEKKEPLTDKAKAAQDAKKNDAKNVAAAKPVTTNNTNKVAETKDESRKVAAATNAQKEETMNRERAASTAPAQSFGQAGTQAVAARADAASGASAEKTSTESLPADRLDRGKYYYEKQNYSAALKEYRVEINNSSKSKRHQATYMAAQCYLKIGNKKEAERLLKIVVDEGGAEKRRAKKLLESIEKPEPAK